MTSELTDDVATHLAALRVVQRYHDNSGSSRQRRPSVRNVQLVYQTTTVYISVECDTVRYWCNIVNRPTNASREVMGLFVE